jgi:hypothetical protein
MVTNYFREPFDALLSRLRWRACSDPRDKIYGLLGLTSARIAKLTAPDCAMSVPDVYKDVFWKLIQLHQRLDHIAGCNSRTRQIDGPSWVPDWTSHSYSSPWFFSLASCLSAAATNNIRSDILEVAGLSVGYLQRVSEPVSSRVAKTQLREVLAWESAYLTERDYMVGKAVSMHTHPRFATV